MRSYARARTSVRCEPTRALCHVLLCSCAGEYSDELMCESLYFCTVRAHKGSLFNVLLSCVHEPALLCGARPQGFCAMCIQMNSCARACAV